MSQTLAAASSFLSGRAYPLSFLPPLFVRLTPYSDYVEVKISLNDSCLLSFLNVYALPIRSSPKNSRTSFFSPLLCGSGSGGVFALLLPQKNDHFRFHIPECILSSFKFWVFKNFPNLWTNKDSFFSLAGLNLGNFLQRNSKSFELLLAIAFTELFINPSLICKSGIKTILEITKLKN